MASGGSQGLVPRWQFGMNSWETGVGGREWEQSEGVIYQLLQQGFSEREVHAIVPVGGS
ncbi:hypothetical protein L914_16998 [Phytophthora nicotianae]|uniref:Uncharacterized protein n=1 Tax=Phytophthora nicotianae TaxID=4792 RepID=W2MIZ5_PHYNI|nr:hypothetical protein L914_16998 [Phytophthora nicotianae]